MEMGDPPIPLWGRVVFHLLTLDLDAAADWYDRMIEHRDPFALVYARAPFAEPLREHHRWPALAARMKLPAGRHEVRSGRPPRVVHLSSPQW
jgi:hypothetical protein